MKRDFVDYSVDPGSIPGFAKSICDEVEDWFVNAHTLQSSSFQIQLPLQEDLQLEVEFELVMRRVIEVAMEALHFTVQAMLKGPVFSALVLATVARTAMISASNAVWVLTPSDPDTRIARFLIFRIDQLQNKKRLFESVKWRNEDVANHETERVEGRIEFLKGQMVLFPLSSKNEVGKRRFLQTKVIEWVAKESYEIDMQKQRDSSLGDLEKEEGIDAGAGPYKLVRVEPTPYVLNAWREVSAAAHGNPDTTEELMFLRETYHDLKGNEFVGIRQDVQNSLLPIVAFSYTTLRRAINLFNDRIDQS